MIDFILLIVQVCPYTSLYNCREHRSHRWFGVCCHSGPSPGPACVHHCTGLHERQEHK